MITMYGIPNCDKIKKAKVWLEKPTANSNGKLMIVMEYMKHGSLHQFIKAKHNTLTKACLLYTSPSPRDRG